VTQTGEHGSKANLQSNAKLTIHEGYMEFVDPDDFVDMTLSKAFNAPVDSAVGASIEGRNVYLIFVAGISGPSPHKGFTSIVFSSDNPDQVLITGGSSTKHQYVTRAGLEAMQLQGMIHEVKVGHTNTADTGGESAAVDKATFGGITYDFGALPAVDNELPPVPDNELPPVAHGGPTPGRPASGRPAEAGDCQGPVLRQQLEAARERESEQAARVLHREDREEGRGLLGHAQEDLPHQGPVRDPAYERAPGNLPSQGHRQVRLQGQHVLEGEAGEVGRHRTSHAQAGPPSLGMCDVFGIRVPHTPAPEPGVRRLRPNPPHGQPRSTRATAGIKLTSMCESIAAANPPF
jgi:hypothetical protein